MHEMEEEKSELETMSESKSESEREERERDGRREMEEEAEDEEVNAIKSEFRSAHALQQQLAQREEFNPIKRELGRMKEEQEQREKRQESRRQETAQMHLCLTEGRKKRAERLAEEGRTNEEEEEEIVDRLNRHYERGGGKGMLGGGKGKSSTIPFPFDLAVIADDPCGECHIKKAYKSIHQPQEEEEEEEEKERDGVLEVRCHFMHHFIALCQTISTVVAAY